MDNIILTKYYDEPKIKYNIISVVVFKIIDSYKSGKKYYDGLNLFNTEIKALNNFYLRVYYDKSIISTNHKNKDTNNEITNLWIPLFKKLKSNPKVQLVEYNHPDFIENNVYHKGLFGTLVRFLPLFTSEDDAVVDIVFVSDIDINAKYSIKMLQKTLNFMNENNTVFHYKSANCYGVIPRFKFVNTNVSNYIIASFMVSKIKFPKDILNTYMECLKHVDNPSCKIIKKFIKSERESIYKMLDVNKKTNLVYGIDELLLSMYLLDYIIKNKISFSYTTEKDPYRSTYMWYLTNDKLKDRKYNYVLKGFLGKYYNEGKTAQENFEILDMYLYKGSFNSKKEIEHNIVKTIKEFKDDKFGFTDKQISCLLSNKSGFVKHDYDASL